MSRGPDFEGQALNAASIFVDRHVSEGRGGRTVFRCGGRSVTYAELARDVNRFGNVLGRLGVEVENRVLLVAHDGPAFAAAFWAAVKVGAVIVPVNTLMTADDYEFLLDDSRAKVAVAEPSVVAKIQAVRRRCPFLKAVVTLGPAAASALGWDDVMTTAPDRLEPAPTSAEDVAYWGYTSGSTGRPKAAVHLHQDLVAAARLVGGGVFGIEPDDLTFSASKMYFAFGLGNSLLFPAYAGAASVLVPERLDAERTFEVIAAERPTVFFTVPTLYARMLQVKDAEAKYDLSSLRLCVSSGEALPPALFDPWRDRFGHELLDVLGSTETLHDFIANRPGRVRRGSTGEVIPGFEARLVDDEGHAVAPGQVGQLLVKGPTNAPFYWKRVERTRRTMLGEWIRTGDMMRQDGDGYFYFVGRSDDMLKVGGRWVSPTEVEAAILEHPDVLEAAVVGRVNGDGLVTPHAFVVLKAGTALAGAELAAFLRTKITGYKVPQSMEFVVELPKTATGKIQRFRLRTAGSA